MWAHDLYLFDCDSYCDIVCNVFGIEEMMDSLQIKLECEKIWQSKEVAFPHHIAGWLPYKLIKAWRKPVWGMAYTENMFKVRCRRLHRIWKRKPIRWPK